MTKVQTQGAGWAFPVLPGPSRTRRGLPEPWQEPSSPRRSALCALLATGNSFTTSGPVYRVKFTGYLWSAGVGSVPRA